MSEKRSRAIVFCDFDGTITSCETFIAVLKHFSPVLSNELIPKILAKEISICDGVRRIVQSIPSSIYPDDMLRFVHDKPVRAGLQSFLDYLDSRQIPFVVVSGGFRCLVEAVLQREHILERCSTVYAVDIDRTHDTLQVHSQWESNTELMAKVNVIRHECQHNEKIIVIGDSITDLNASKCADIVFARDALCTYLNDEKISYYNWNDFNDIKIHLEQLADHCLF
jgi:2-hydroxy-3-keto-5-methylthiopentenyl-1-phosphate phosphatase